MVEDNNSGTQSAEELLSQVQELVPVVLDKSKEVRTFSCRWKSIISKIEQIPSRLSDLSSHPCFSKNTLCKEQVHAVSKTLNESLRLAKLCIQEKYEGKLRMQSDLDAVAGKLDLNLRDCGVLIKTGVLGEATLPLSISNSSETAMSSGLRELLARIQIGHLESKHRALDRLVDIMKEDEKSVLAVLGRNNIAALVQLLTSTSPCIRDKAVTLICSLAESGGCEMWLVSEGVLPPLVRILEFGSLVSKEKAAISLQRLTMSPETARAIAGHGGVRALIELCKTGDSVLQAAAVCTLKNVLVVPDARQNLAEEGIVQVMIDLLNCGILLGTRESAAECLQNLTASDENLRKAVISENGVQNLLNFLDGPLPQEPAVSALRNLVGSVSLETLVSLDFLPRLAHVLKSGSPGAQQAAASAVLRFAASPEAKRLVGESGCVPLLINLLEAKSNSCKEAAAQAIASLIGVPSNCREVKRDEKSVPSLVQLLDAGPQNAAKKYAVECLLALSRSKRCKKMMVAYGAIGYLKKLAEMDAVGAKKLLGKLERGSLRRSLSAIGHGLYTHPDLKVSELIAENGYWMPTAFLAKFFPEELVTRIREIRLTRTKGINKQIWHFTTSGTFTVKSCYTMLQKRTSEDAEGHMDVDSRNLCKILWKFDVPPKLRHFFWRIATKTLPVQVALCQKRMIANAVCWRCGQTEEDCLHLLLTCPFARDTWFLSGFGQITMAHRVNGAADWIRRCIMLLRKAKSEDGELRFLWTCWHIWLQRNTIIFGGKKLHMTDLLREIHNSVCRWMETKKGKGQGKAEDRITEEMDHPFQTNRFTRLCSIDASWKDCESHTGAGLALWNTNGDLNSLVSKRGPRCNSAGTAEAEALYQAARHCLDQEIHAVCFFTDNRELLKVIKGDADSEEPGSVISEIRMLLSRFNFFDILFVPRQFNTVADAVAKHASLNTDDRLVIWSGQPVWLDQDVTLFTSYLNEIKVLGHEDDAKEVPTSLGFPGSVI